MFRRIFLTQHFIRLSLFCQCNRVPFAAPPMPASRHIYELPLSGMGSGAAKKYRYIVYRTSRTRSVNDRQRLYAAILYNQVRTVSRHCDMAQSHNKFCIQGDADDMALRRGHTARNTSVQLRSPTSPASQPAHIKVASVWSGKWGCEAYRKRSPGAVISGGVMKYNLLRLSPPAALSPDRSSPLFSTGSVRPAGLTRCLTESGSVPEAPAGWRIHRWSLSDDAAGYFREAAPAG